MKFVKFLGESVRAIQPHLILLQVKLGHIPNILPLTWRPEKFSQAKSGQCRRFLAFFCFSNITAELFISEENSSRLEFRSHEDASFPVFGCPLRQFSAELLEKMLELSKLRTSCLSS